MEPEANFPSVNGTPDAPFSEVKGPVDGNDNFSEVSMPANYESDAD